MTESSNAVTPTAVQVAGADDVPINVWDYGGDGPPLMLCHCTGTHTRIWDPLVPGLLDDFHVYGADTRGHGDSHKPKDPEAYAWQKSGQDLLAVLEGLGLTQDVYGVGHSAGAAHIAYVAVEHPEIFSKIILIDAIIGPKEFFPRENPLAVLVRRRKNVFESAEAARARYASKPPMGAWDAAVLDAYVAHGFDLLEGGAVELKCPGHIEAEVYQRGGSPDLFAKLDTLSVPTTLVTATESNVRYLVDAQHMKLPAAELVVIEGASHFVPQEKPAEIVELIRERFC